MLFSSLVALLISGAIAGPCEPEKPLVGYHSQFGPQTITSKPWKDQHSIPETSSDTGIFVSSSSSSSSAQEQTHHKPSHGASSIDNNTWEPVSTSKQGWGDHPSLPGTTSGTAPIETKSTSTQGWSDHLSLPGTTSGTAPVETKSTSKQVWGDHPSRPGTSSASTPVETGMTSTESITSATVTTTDNSTTGTSSATVTSTTNTATSTALSTIQYSPVTGYFLQDEDSTEPTGFDYAAVNFGLINQTYDTDTDDSLTQWERFAAKLADLQANAEAHTSYKLIFMGRHGEGNHNAMETYVGTPAWNCYWALLEGANSSFIYADAPVTEEGISQAEKAHAYWASRISQEKIPFIQSYYSSPMRRCLETAELTFAGLDLPRKHPFKPIIKEGLREGMSEHTCNRRSTKSWIAENYPEFSFEAGFTEEDELWTGVTTEVSAAQDFRTKQMLDDIFQSDEMTYLSFTSHSGEITSILRVVGHRAFRLSTGQIIPVLIKAETTTPEEATTTVTSATWTPSPFCTQPPVTSIPSWGNGGGCVCQSSAEPVITEMPDFPTSTPTPVS